MRKSDFMLQVVLELVKRDGVDADIEEICQFAYRTCNNLVNFETAYNETIFDKEKESPFDIEVILKRQKAEEENKGVMLDKTPKWKPENVKVNDYVGFHYEGHRDQEGQVTFISKKIVPELSIRTKDGKSWKVSRDNIFDPSKLLEK